MFPLGITHLLIIAQIVQISTQLPEPTQSKSFSSFLKELLPPPTLCSLLLIWSKNTERFIGNEDQVVNSLVNYGTTIILTYEDSETRIALPNRSEKSRSNNCVISIVTMFFKLNEPLITRLISPEISPPTIPNTDRFIFFTNKVHISELIALKTLEKIKFKVIVPVDEKNPWKLEAWHTCNYCPNGPVFRAKKSFELSTDFQKNYHGSTLSLSTTTKVPQLLELKVRTLFDRTLQQNKTLYEAYRGVYAKVLIHLANKLNFSYEIIPSSGNGSTGHSLPNGTWVGIVGDVFYEKADFGFMAATTEQRFPYVEFCAPINFAFLGFATGPPDKVYSAKAIFWPLKTVVWVCTLVASCLTVLGFKFLLSFPIFEDEPYWSMREIVFYFTRCILEQCGTLNLKSDSLKVYLTFWLLFSMIISTVYRSKMVTLMTFPEYETVPGSMDELADSAYEINFHYFGNVGYSFMKTSKSPYLKSLYEKMGREPDPIACLQKVVKGKQACIIFIVTFQELKFRNLSDRHGNSPVTFSPHRGIMWSAGIVHRHKAPFYINFKSIIDQSMEMGLIEHWQTRDFVETLKNKNQWEKTTKNVVWDYIAEWAIENDVTFADLLQLKKLKGAFGIYIGGLSLSLIWFGLESLHHKIRIGFPSNSGVGSQRILW